MKIANQIFFVIAAAIMVSCNSGSEQVAATGSESSPAGRGQSGVQDETSAPNIVQVASGSKDHSTLVAAVLAAKLEDALSNAGPFTVFAPTDEAFAKIPQEQLNALLQDKAALSKVLTYHVVPGQVMAQDVKTGSVNTVEGSPVSITVQDGKVMINNANVVTTDVVADNGVIHVIDTVLLPGN